MNGKDCFLWEQCPRACINPNFQKSLNIADLIAMLGASGGLETTQRFLNDINDNERVLYPFYLDCMRSAAHEVPPIPCSQDMSENGSRKKTRGEQEADNQARQATRKTQSNYSLSLNEKPLFAEYIPFIYSNGIEIETGDNQPFPLMMDSLEKLCIRVVEQIKVLIADSDDDSRPITILWVGCGFGEEVLALYLFCLINNISISIDAIDCE